MNGLTCLMENCSWDSSKACCTNQTLQKDCGSQGYKCLYGEGHCNNDNDCQDLLRCTANSCKWYIPNPPNRIFRASCCDNVTGLILSV